MSLNEKNSLVRWDVPSWANSDGQTLLRSRKSPIQINNVLDICDGWIWRPFKIMHFSGMCMFLCCWQLHRNISCICFLFSVLLTKVDSSVLFTAVCSSFIGPWRSPERAKLLQKSTWCQKSQREVRCSFPALQVHTSSRNGKESFLYELSVFSCSTCYHYMFCICSGIFKSFGDCIKIYFPE